MIGFPWGKDKKAKVKQETADTSPPAIDEEGAEEGANAPVEHAEVPNEAPSGSKSKKGGGERVKENAGKQSVGSTDVPNPRQIILEGIAHQAVTLTKTNTALKIAVVVLGLSTGLSSLFAYTAWHKEQVYRYFFMGSNGQLLEYEPVTEPAFSLNMIRDFYAESLSYLFSFHYNNFDMHYQRLGPDIMTDRAMIEFANELDRIGLRRDMSENREVAEAVITQVPVLLSSDLDPQTGAFTWELSVPINIRLESGLSSRNNVRQLRGVARVQIVRVPPTVHPRQFLINRITIGDRG